MPDFPWTEELIEESKNTETLFDGALKWYYVFNPLSDKEARDPNNWEPI